MCSSHSNLTSKNMDKIQCTGHDAKAIQRFRTRSSYKKKPWIAKALSPPYARESERLQSFHNYRRADDIMPRDLAMNGFYYAGWENVVICFSCGVHTRNLVRPSENHYKMKPTCKMAIGFESRNITEEDEDAMKEEKAMSDDDGEPKTPDGPKGEEFRSVEKRFESFKYKWSKEFLVPASELAKNGFFYSGTADKVTCAYCGVSIKNFARNDTAYGEHMRRSPDCAFLKGVNEQEVGDSKDVDEVKKFATLIGYTKDKIEEVLARMNGRVTCERFIDAVTQSRKDKTQEKCVELEKERDKLMMKCGRCNKMSSLLLIPCRHLSCNNCPIDECGKCGKKVIGVVKFYLA